jgi:hypothetical protein
VFELSSGNIVASVFRTWIISRMQTITPAKYFFYLCINTRSGNIYNSAWIIRYINTILLTDLG